MSKKKRLAKGGLGVFETEAQALEKGQQHFASGQYPEAIRIWTRLAELNPTSPIKSRLAEAHFRKALALYRSNAHINSIISELNFCIRYDPDCALYWHHLGLAYFKAGIFAKAVSNFKKAAALDPGCERYAYHQALAALESSPQEAFNVIAQNLGKSARWDYASALLELKENRPQSAFRAVRELEDEKGEVLFLKGIAAHMEGRPDLAVEFLQMALHKSASNPVLVYYLGNAYFALNDVEQAVRWWQGAYEAGLRNPELVQNLANAYTNRALDFIAQRQADEAIACFLHILSLAPTRAAEIKPLLAGCYALKGNSAAQEGKLAEAIKAWSEAIALYNQIQQTPPVSSAKSTADDPISNHITALYHNQALAYDQLGDSEKALLYWEKVVNHWRRTNKGEKQDDEFLVSAYRHLGEVYQKLGRLRDAITAYEQVIRYNPDVVDVQEELGELYLAEAQWPKAAAYWSRVAKLKENDSDAHTKCGIALARTGRRQEAIEHWKRAIALEPKNTFAKNEIYRSREEEILELLDDERFDRALRILEELLDLIPDLPIVRIRMSDAYWGKGRRDKAMEQIDLAIATNPDSPPVWIQVVHSLLFNDRTKEAHAIIQRAETRFAENPLFYLALGHAYLDFDRDKKATQYFDKALMLARRPDVPESGRFPNYGLLAMDIAHEWIELDDFGKARKYIKIAIEANPEDGERHYMLGCSYAEDAMMSEAEKAWSRAEELAERAGDENLLNDIRSARRYFVGRGDPMVELQDLMKLMKMFR